MIHCNGDDVLNSFGNLSANMTTPNGRTAMKLEALKVEKTKVLYGQQRGKSGCGRIRRVRLPRRRKSVDKNCFQISMCVCCVCKRDTKYCRGRKSEVAMQLDLKLVTSIMKESGFMSLPAKRGADGRNRRQGTARGRSPGDRHMCRAVMRTPTTGISFTRH